MPEGKKQTRWTQGRVLSQDSDVDGSDSFYHVVEFLLQGCGWADMKMLALSAGWMCPASVQWVCIFVVLG